MDRRMSAHPEQPRESILRLLRTRAPLAQAERSILVDPAEADSGKLRQTLLDALAAEASLSDADQAALALQEQKDREQLRSALRAHLEAPSAIPEQDLGLYSPPGEGNETPAERGLLGRLEESSAQTEEVASLPYAAEASRVSGSGPRGGAETKHDFSAQQAPSVVLLRPQPERGAATMDGSVDGVREAHPLSYLSSALQDVGADSEEYGYLLRHGRYARGGRKSEFVVGGLGLAEFSRRLAKWLEERGANNFPLQVVDDGSGELTVYVLGEEPT